MIKYFDTNSINSAKQGFMIAPGGFRYGFIPNLFKEDVYEKLMASFPDVKKFKLVDQQSGGGRKRFFHGPQYVSYKHNGCVCHFSKLSKIWKEVLREASSPELINLLAKSTGVNFNSLDVFGFTFGNGGCMQEAHLDGAIRDNPDKVRSPIATLLYFNDKPDNVSGTCIYAPDRKTVLFQVPSLRNGLFFFEQNMTAWHGFPEMPQGAERKLVSLVYSIEKEPVELKESLIHKATCMPGFKYRIKQAIGKAI